MTLKIDFKVKFKVINGCLPLNPTTFVRVIFRYYLYLRSYIRGWIKMAHPVYENFIVGNLCHRWKQVKCLYCRYFAYESDQFFCELLFFTHHYKS